MADLNAQKTSAFAQLQTLRRQHNLALEQAVQQEAQIAALKRDRAKEERLQEMIAGLQAPTITHPPALHPHH